MIALGDVEAVHRLFEESLAVAKAAGNREGRGWAHQGLGEFEEAISFYQNHISYEGASLQVLNSIGECFFRIGNHAEAQRAWEKSLEIKSDQPEIKKKLEEIKKREDKS